MMKLDFPQDLAPEGLLLQDFIDRLLPFIHEKLEEFMKNDAIILKTLDENDYSILKNIIQDCIRLIRWNNISSTEFWQNRSFFQKVLSKEQYDDILAYYLDSTTPPAKIVMLKLRHKPTSQEVKKFEESSYLDLANINEKLLKERLNYDVIIRVDKGRNLKEFHAHSLILNTRSPDFFGNSSNLQVENDGKYSIITFENISARTFENILRYLYTAKIILDDLEVLQLFSAVNELNLKDFMDKIIFFMHQDLEGFMKHDSVDVLKIVFQYDECKSLRNMCLQFICSSPDSLFDHQKFIQLDKSIFTLILQRDDLGKLNEIDIWNYLVKWGKEFSQNLSFLENILSSKLYNNILNYHLDPNSLPKEIIILPPRYKLDHMPLIRSEQFNIIASWIDKKDLEKHDQSGPDEFHKLCDNKGPTITIAKLRINNNSEICLFGGYNNLSWKYYGHKKNQYYTFSKSNKNFLFLFDDENDFTTSKIARVKKSCFAVGYCSDIGPIFGSKNYYYYFDSKPTFKKWLTKCSSKSNYPDFKTFAKLQKSSSYTVLDYDVWQTVEFCEGEFLLTY
ncbi:14963_t:CDS:2 [Gigaspora rosea]|nr:14963_t:CDS:2 [Gigaspora rosea]